ncbi:MAG TPA: TonB-dependent receptor [Prolixibacteraceae bacterium]|nr:TonB-dependent receptor [Prolixibacteraceae bacterium]
MKDARFNLKIRSILIVVLTLVFGFSANAQKISVTGIVKDAAGETVIGASVLEKGTTNGITTNFNGEFTLSVSSNATLVVSYVGYKTQEVPVAGKKNLVITLEEDAQVLGEVVAIGYATVKKSDATGSVTAIRPDKMNKGLTTNAQDMIAGKIAGVTVTSDGGAPGAGSKIRIRGGSSLNASNDPLIVIDGLALDNEGIKGVSNLLSTINPNDIETFTVLKDASATAIYGSRASNGVILITTKKGQKGKLRISYDGNMSVSTLNKQIDVLTGDEYRDYAKKLYADQPDVIAKLGTANTNWQDQIYQNAVSNDHNISLSGMALTVPYHVSVGYTGQKGILKTSNFERVTGSINLNPSFFNDALKVNLSAKGMYAKTRYADTGAIGAAVAMDPTQTVESSKEPFQSKFGGYWAWYQTDDKIGIIQNPQATYNPVATLMLNSDVAKSKDFIGSASFDYKLPFLPELTAHLNLGTEISTGKQDLLQPVTMSNRNNYYGRQGWDQINKKNESLTYFMQYAKEFGSSNFDIMGGYEWQHFYREQQNDYKGLFKTDTNSDGVVDSKDDYYDHVEKTKDNNKYFATESYLVSFFGRLNYNLLNRYLFTATLRDDASSRFAEDTRWGLFPSFAFAWKINEESFLKDVRSISDLKLRLGYGITGQQNLLQGDYPYIPVYTSSMEGAFYQFDNKYVTTARPDAYNPKLKWEETTTYNVGLDFGLWNSRLTGSLDVYQRDTKDLINVVQIPAGTNFRNKVISNIGNMTNKGAEFSINAKAISNKDMTWEIGYNVTYNRNKITKLTNGSEEGYYVATGGTFQGTTQAHSVGFPASSFYVYEQVYDKNNKPIEGLFVDRSGDGIINEADKYFYHNPNADFTMGLTSKLTYHHFDLGFSLRGSIGNYNYNAVEAGRLNVGTSGLWSPLGYYSNVTRTAMETKFSGKSTIQFMSDHYIQNASFVRCDNITLGYSFDKLLNIISGGRIYATVQNPFVITKYKGLDPEVFGGIDGNLYPRPIISVIGVSLNF